MNAIKWWSHGNSENAISPVIPEQAGIQASKER